MKWFQMESSQHPLSVASQDFPIHLQYLMVLGICLLEFFIFHIVIRGMISLLIEGEEVTLAKGNHISMALVLSSFGKILLIVMVIWDYGKLNPAFFINLFVLICNFVALQVCLDVSTWLSSCRVFLILLAAVSIKTGVQSMITPTLA